MQATWGGRWATSAPHNGRTTSQQTIDKGRHTPFRAHPPLPLGPWAPSLTHLQVVEVDVRVRARLCRECVGVGDEPRGLHGRDGDVLLLNVVTRRVLTGRKGKGPQPRVAKKRCDTGEVYDGWSVIEGSGAERIPATKKKSLRFRHYQNRRPRYPTNAP